jgi:hypothetical protein
MQRDWAVTFPAGTPCSALEPYSATSPDADSKESPMKHFARMAALGLVLGLISIPRAGQASGTVSLTWDDCSGPVNKTSAGPGTYSLYASVIGLDEGHKAYEVWIKFGDASDTVPDAWRFDLAGCQGNTQAAVEYLPSAAIAASCPALHGNLLSLQMSTIDQWPAPFGLPTTLMRANLAVAYPAGVDNPDPAQRYFMGRFVFNHANSGNGASSSGTCGGLETPIYFGIYRTNYVTLNNMEAPFTHSENPVASFNGQLGAPVTAQPSTWGAIKNQYRR